MNDGLAERALPYSQYSIDYLGGFQFVYEKIFRGDWQSFLDTLDTIWTTYSIIAILLSMVLFAGFIYAKIRYAQLSDIEQEALRDAEKAWANKHAKPDSRNARWDVIQKRVTENSPESWRIAIIEADIMLDETLSNAGYPGQSLGEKLKGANPQSFTTIQDAWEAHKVRNEIAHAGSDFILTQRTAQDTITRFERVFREFGVV
jgi:hypothetical protein